MKLLIIRHGDPDYSIDSLTEKGWREAEYLSQRISKLDVSAIYCSPLGRARNTAKLTLEKLGMTAEICDWLMEFPGYIIDEESGNKTIPWDMMPSVWTKNNDYYDNEIWTQNALMQSGNVTEKLEAAKKGLDALLLKHGYCHEGKIFRAEKPNNDTVVIFCHFGIECVLLSHLTAISPMALWHNFIALPSSVTTLVTEEREEGTAAFRINSFGDLSHLYANDESPSFAGRFCETYNNKEERH